MTITWQTIITAASVVTALGVLGAVAIRCIKWLDTQNKQNAQIEEIKAEQSLLTTGVLACLKGLAEQGCDGPVHDAITQIEVHLNKQAHK